MMTNVRDFGVWGDGTDDTAALQRILDGFAAGANRTGRIDLPAGTYRVTSPLVYRGSWGYTIRLAGEAACSGPSGSVIRYDGPPDRPVIEVAGGGDVVLEHISIDASKARFGIYAHQDRPSGIGVSNLLLDRVIIGCNKSPKSACVSLGVDPSGVMDTFQCDDIVIRSCKFFGGECGVATGTANVKNFFVETSIITGAGYGFSFGGSGPCVLRDCVFGNNTSADVYATIGNVLIDSCTSEGSGMLLRTAGLSSNAAMATIRNTQWYGATAQDDVAVSWGGALRLEMDHFHNARAARSLPRIRLLVHPSNAASLVSEGNFYRMAAKDYTDGTMPSNKAKSLFLGGGVEDDLFKYPDRAAWLRCFGDYGGDGGAIVRMKAR